MKAALPPATDASAERVVAGILGLLLGDALGVPVEFCTQAELDADPVRGPRGGGAWGQPPGTWSDDGALTMAQVSAFLAHGWEPARHLDAFLAWWQQGDYSARGEVFDIGTTTRRALAAHGEGRTAAEAGLDDPDFSSNGSLMRNLAAACWWAWRPAEEAIAGAMASSALTHPYIRPRLCCAWHALLARALLAGASIEEGLRQAADQLWPLVPAAERERFRPLADGSFLAWPRPRLESRGEVLATLLAACWCLHRAPRFAEAVLAAVNLGGDTDTVGAVVGGLAGLRAGLAGLPDDWLAVLARRAWAEELARRFAAACLARRAAAS